MKNNCDVGGNYPWCGGYDCMFLEKDWNRTCTYDVDDRCTSLAAIKDAIEKERAENGN